MEFMNKVSNDHGVSAELVLGNVVVNCFRSNKFIGPEDSFQPSRIMKHTKIVWAWDKWPTRTINKILEVNDVIAVIRIFRGKVVEVVFPEDIGSKIKVNVSGKEAVIGGFSVEKSLDLKCKIANMVDMKVDLTPEEDQLLRKKEKAVAEASAKQQQALEAQKHAERKAREARKQEFLKKILAREKIEVLTTKGNRQGIPVVSDEWGRLERGTRVILMKDQKAVEAFIVGRNGAKPVKIAPADVVENTSMVKKSGDVQVLNAERLITIKYRGEVHENVPVFKSVEDVRLAQANGLNSGSWVAFPDARHPDRLQVNAVYHDRMDTIGVVRPTSAMTAEKQ